MDMNDGKGGDDEDGLKGVTSAISDMQITIGNGGHQSNGHGGLNGSSPKMMPLVKFKVVFLGDQGVGKTSIVSSFTRGALDSSDYQVTTRCFRFFPRFYSFSLHNPNLSFAGNDRNRFHV